MNKPIRYIETSALIVGYEESGPSHGYPVILQHGWPDDVRTWDKVASMLNKEGFRTIAPYLRGVGQTRFKSDDFMRTGQLSAVGNDLVEVADALKLDNFAVVGHDWGARAAYISSFLLPDRVQHCVALSVGYGTNNPDQKLSLEQIKNYWYHWYMASEQGKELLEKERRKFCRFMWETWSPLWHFSDKEFDDTAMSFENTDWAEVVLHSYRHRWGFVQGDPRYDELEKRLSAVPAVTVPTLVLHGEEDKCNDPSTSMDKENYFIGPYKRKLISGAGHFPQREYPEVVAKEIVNWIKNF
ncbi:MAG TPA: alpha/beta hydrolase [Desulfitobacterium dehalogenans]|uniref:Alpha/beta hydrolase n=1 Tax=Desulfitobacterium dehalogenans TaxID=36854 RepID=A0A7C6Z270_9FIRM|nr:alpha/beta hydrolase [Desulfitobacterium dehalogenans]